VPATFALAALFWSEEGNSRRVAAQGNNPPTRVIWLHYDYMVKEGPHAHSHAPDPRAIQLVIEAFRRHGVTLHIDPVHNAIPERKVVTLRPVNPTCAGPDAVDVHDLRAAYFQPHGNHTWHYAVFGHRVTCPDGAHCLACAHDPACGGLPDSESTGGAELPGENFVVTFGSYFDGGETISLSTEAATFMHELGHNLGLLHGGDNVCINNKPNYISVMNYAYQPGGIAVSDAPGSTAYKVCDTDSDCGDGAFCDPATVDVLGAPICLRVDYSDQKLPGLSEFSPSLNVLGLDENAGVSGDPGDTDIVRYFVPGPTQRNGPSYGPIDWNGDGDATGVHVPADINNDGFFGLLSGFDDWAYLQAFLNTPAYRNGIVRQNPTVVTCGR